MEDWVGLEPTFTNRKAVRKWARLAAEPGGEDRYFEHPYMLRKQARVMRALRDKYRRDRAKGHPACPFDEVRLKEDRDPWDVERQCLILKHHGEEAPFELRLGLDPEVFEFTLKPVPVVLFYDPRFTRFLQRYVWNVPQRRGLVCAMAHGGGQCSFSASTYLSGSLLADELAHRLDHPERATWTMDFPNADDRALRATRRRFDAWRDVLRAYWDGAFHPRAAGVPTVEDALFDHGWDPALDPPEGLMDPATGPVGEPNEVFQTNFRFGRAARLRAQAVHPGYWQAARPDEKGYRTDQVMRYSEGNLNRLQIRGELHVKSLRLLGDEAVPDLEAPLDASMLYAEASFEDRAQMSHPDALDQVEAVLLDVHHMRYLAAHPHVQVRASLLQDQLMLDGAEVLARRAPQILELLRQQARRDNIDLTHGRVQSDWIEPETLFWSVWRHLPATERGAIAREAVEGFVERVEQAATFDPRPERRGRDPLEPHRHRVHPELWAALSRVPAADRGNVAHRELGKWQDDRERFLSRRPMWSPTGEPPPWQTAP